MQPLVDSNGNGIVDLDEIQDERIAWAVRVGGAGQLGRSLCIAPDGNIWLGTYYDRRCYRISSANGSVLAGPYAVGVNPYGCGVDSQGSLWSASISNALGRLDTNTGAASVYYHAGTHYGIAVGNNKVYLALYQAQVLQ